MVKADDIKIYANVFDSFTIRNLEKLMSRRSLDRLVRPIKVGKESNVFLAENYNGYVVAKIYRVANCNFNKMYDYLIADPRFVGLKKSRRKVVIEWSKREFINLKRAFKSGVSCPQPIDIVNNVIVMTLIGDNETGKEGIQLKDYVFRSKNELVRIFEMLFEEIKILVEKARQIHADLSEFNVLVFNAKPYLIDFSQSIPTNSYKALDFLNKDINNIKRFLSRIEKRNGVDLTCLKKKLQDLSYILNNELR